MYCVPRVLVIMRRESQKHPHARLYYFMLLFVMYNLSTIVLCRTLSYSVLYIYLIDLCLVGLLFFCNNMRLTRV